MTTPTSMAVPGCSGITIVLNSARAAATMMLAVQLSNSRRCPIPPASLVRCPHLGCDDGHNLGCDDGHKKALLGGPPSFAAIAIATSNAKQ